MRRLSLSLALALSSCGMDAAPHLEAATTTATAGDRFTPGDVLRYRFEWSVGTTAEAPGVLPQEVPVSGGLHLAGEVEVRVLAPVDGQHILAFAWTRLDAHAVTIMGADVLPDASDLLGEEAYVVVADDGDIADVYFEPDAPDLFRHLMSGMLAQTELRVLRSDERTKAARIPTSSGLADAEYAWAEPPRTLTRSLRRYVRFDGFVGPAEPQLEGTATIVLGVDGIPERLDAVEIAWVSGDDLEQPAFHSQTNFTLERQAVAHEPPVEAPALDLLVRRDLSAPPDEEEARRLLAQRFAGDLQPIDVAQAIRSASLGGLRPRAGFMIEATGLLRGWPELASDLEDTFFEQVDVRGRLLTADVLASAGTPEAQEVLRTILDDDRVRDQPEYTSLLQRLTFVWRPTPDTARFLLAQHERARSEADERTRQAVLYPLGTTAARVAPIDPYLAELMHARLTEELENASDPMSTVAALAGIGNSGRVDDLDAVLAHIHDEDPAVRAQVASTLRSAADAEATTALFELLLDDDPFVARSAVIVLDRYRLDEAGSVQLASIGLAGHVHPEALGKLTSALARRLDDDPLVPMALLAIQERSPDIAERDRIGRILDAT